MKDDCSPVLFPWPASWCCGLLRYYQARLSPEPSHPNSAILFDGAVNGYRKTAEQCCIERTCSIHLIRRGYPFHPRAYVSFCRRPLICRI
jgi:hypothetical protein